MDYLIPAFVILAAALAAARIGASVAWNRKTTRMVSRLGAPGEPAPFDPSQLENVPEPVARYLRAVLPEGRTMAGRVKLFQEGEFRIYEGEKGWRPLEADQYFSIAPPGFVWDARIRTSPAMAVRVRDAYLGGEGSIEARLGGLIPLVTASGRPELAQAALQRYLAESVWFPIALLPRHGLSWSPLGENSARATLRDGGVIASLDFHFDENGLIVRAETTSRYREVDGTYEPTPWTCHYRDYRERHGFRVPVEGEAVWELADGPRSYWRGRLEEIEFEG